jgi:hypothetical protein
MKMIASAVAVSMLLLQGCSTVNPGKFNFGLEQRQNALTGAQTNGLTPKITYTATFGGDTQKAKAQDEMAMNVDGKKSDNEALIIGGLVVLALALKQSESKPKKTCTIGFPVLVVYEC